MSSQAETQRPAEDWFSRCKWVKHFSKTDCSGAWYKDVESMVLAYVSSEYPNLNYVQAVDEWPSGSKVKLSGDLRAAVS